MTNFTLGRILAQERRRLVEVLDARADIEGLAAAIALAQQRLADDERVEGRNEGPHREPIDRRRRDDRHFAHAGHRQLQRAGNWRGGKRQHVHFSAQLLQPLLVPDAEMLLLVDDDEAKILEAAQSCPRPRGCRRRCRSRLRQDPSSPRGFRPRRPCAKAAPTVTGRPAKRWRKFCACWRASSVVGATIAVCLPFMAVAKAARSATSVLPKPTSPHTSRSIGRPAAEVIEGRLNGSSPGPASRRKESERRIRRTDLRGQSRRGAVCIMRWAATRMSSPAISRTRFFRRALRDCQPAPPSLSRSPVSEPKRDRSSRFSTGKNSRSPPA